MLDVSRIISAFIALGVGALAAVLLYRFAHWTRAWAISSGAAVILLLLPGGWWFGLPRNYAQITSVALAALFGGFVFIASRRQGRRLRAALIASLIGFGIMAVFNYPIETHPVKLDMPRPG